MNITMLSSQKVYRLTNHVLKCVLKRFVVKCSYNLSQKRGTNLIEFVPATIEDLPFIVQVYNQTIPSRMATGDVEPVSVEDRTPWFKSHNQQTRPLLVIKVDNQQAGWVSLNDFYDRDSYRKLAEVSIYIHPDFRGQHVGSQTLDYLDQHVTDYDIDSVVSLIFGHNQPSLRLFKSHGYEQWGLLPKIAEMDGNKYDLVILGKHF